MISARRNPGRSVIDPSARGCARHDTHLACRLSLVGAVVAVDALANAHRFEPTVIDDVRRRHLGARGSAYLTEVVANRLSNSPMETRIRLAVEYDGKNHRTQERALRDLTRQAYLSGEGPDGPALHGQW